MAKSTKILGVLCGDFNLVATVVDWVEIHPLYPEQTLREVMIQGLMGTQKIGDAANFLEKTTNEQLSPIWDLK